MNGESTSDALELLTNFEPMITMEDINRVEPLEKERSTKRRLMLATLTKDSKELFKIAEDDPAVTKELFHYVTDYVRTTKALLEMSQACCSRLMASIAGLDDEVAALAGLDDDAAVKAIFDEWAEAIGQNVDKDRQ